MTTEEQRERARALLNDDLFKEVIEEIEADAVRRFKASAVDDDEARREARFLIEAMRRVVSSFKRRAGE
jgi:hypothetical protein